MALSDRIAAEIRDLDQTAARKLSQAKAAARERINEARYSRELKKEQQSSLRQRISSDVGRARDVEPGSRLRDKVARDLDRSRNDVEPGTEAGDRLREQQSAGLARRLAQAAASVGDPTPNGPQTSTRGQRAPSDGQDRMLERANRAARVSPPTDHTVSPVDDRGISTFQDFVTGRRMAEGMQRFEQTRDNQSAMEWQGTHSDGSVTVVTASDMGGKWTITATEVAPNGRQNGSLTIGDAVNRAEARERALDWIEDNPEGIPFHSQTGQFGAAGFATGDDPYRDSLVFGDGGADVAGGGGLVGGDDLDFVFGGDE